MLRLAVLCLFLLAATARADDYPIGTPETMFEGDNRIGAFRAWEALFPTRAVARGGGANELPAGKAIDLSAVQEDFLARSQATGLIVLKDGVVRLERYWIGATPTSRLTSMSVAKSVTSVLIGAALADGAINSIDDPVTDYLPELTGSAYEGVPISALLQMSSGAAFDEAPGTYADAMRFWQATPSAMTRARSPLPGP